MWYVIQTLNGEEEKTANMIKKCISPCYIMDCFVPKRERIKKFHGRWNKIEEILFQGYVFVISEEPEKVYQRLREIPKLTKLLGREGNYFVPLDDEEERLVRKLGDERHMTSLSQVEIKEGRLARIIGGPLKDYVGNVVKVNLHKREAVISVEFMGRMTELKMGVEMMEKET